MAQKKAPLTGLLRKPIRLDEAPARGLNAAFAIGPDASDLEMHVRNELHARWTEFDKSFGVESGQADIWEQRAKALVEREFEVKSNDPRWWERLALRMAMRGIGGFSVRGFDERRPGLRATGPRNDWLGCSPMSNF